MYTRRSDTSITGCSSDDKRRIDSMFEESKSIISGSTRSKPTQRTFSNSGNRNKQNDGNDFEQSVERRKFAVAYLGSIPISSKVTSLEALQRPLKELYLRYKRENGNFRRFASRLEITKEGLKVKHKSEGKRELNRFPTIAVWAALKLVRQSGAGDQTPTKYAFVPLIADPRKSDKIRLFWKPSPTDESILVRKPTQDDLPLFTVVMKKSGRLECHCFVCGSGEEAVIAAATLYRALVQAMPQHQSQPVNAPVQSKPSPQSYPNPLVNSANPHRGDVLTKVAIPRSKCFLDRAPFGSRWSGGFEALGSCSSSRAGSKMSVDHDPLGLDRLFAEFRHQEGLYNVDQILGNIINSDGMSFNDLKPIYKEFLLKLALALTKDELYQRSKLIMRRQRFNKKRQRRRNVLRFKKTLAVGGNIKRAFEKTLADLKSSKPIHRCTGFTTILLRSCGKTISRKRKAAQRCRRKLGNPWKYSSMVDTLLQRGTAIRTGKNDAEIGTALTRLVDSDENLSDIDSDQKDYIVDTDVKFPAKGPNKERQVCKQCFSAYLPCSECSCDSETCTCTSAEKCYCSLGKMKLSQHDHTYNTLREQRRVCDEKLAHERQLNRLSIFEQLKLQGFAVSESSRSRSESPIQDRQKPLKEKLSEREKLGIKSSKSLEFLQTRYPRLNGHLKDDSKINMNTEIKSKNNGRPKQIKSYRNIYSSEDDGKRENIHVQDELFEYHNQKNELNRDKKEKKILVVSARDSLGKVVYMGSTCRKTKTNWGFGGQLAENEALSLKKSAEIASLFYKIGTCKEEVIYNTLEPIERQSLYQSKDTYSEVNLENSLGYFP